MRIEGHQNHLFTNQRRVDSEHPTKPKNQADNGPKPRLSTRPHLSGLRTTLVDKFKETPEVRPEEVDRVAEKLRSGQYSTRGAAEQTAATILASLERTF